MQITVAGIGYVGLSNAILLSQENDVIAIDISQERVDLVNQKKSPLVDYEIEKYLSEKSLNLRVTGNPYNSSKTLLTNSTVPIGQYPL